MFSKRKLEPEAPERRLSRTEDLKSECYPLSKVGRSIDYGMRIERVQNEQGLGGNISPVMMHKRQGDSLMYNGEIEYMGLNASDIKQGNAAQLAMNTTGGYASEYLGLKDENRFTACQNEDYMDSCLRPNIIGGYYKNESDNSRVHGEGRLSIRDRLMSNSLPETDQRMVFSNDVPGLHNSNVNPSGFYSKPMLEHNSLVQNQLRPTSTMIRPIQTQILNNTFARQGDTNSRSTSLLYDLDMPGLNFSQASSVRISDGSKPTMESVSPSNNFGRNSLSSQPWFNHTELKDKSGWNTVGDFRNSVLYGSSRDCMPLSMVQNSDQLAAESVIYEACDIPSLKSLSATVHQDNGKSSSLHNPSSSLFCNHQSWLGNDFHSTALRENPSREMALQKNNETFTPDHSWESEGHYEDGDPLIHEYDIGCYGVSQNNGFGYPKKKSSVFSRLSFMQDVNKHKNRNNVRNEEYDLHTKVDEVMERVRQSQNKWMNKRNPNPKRNKPDSLRDKTQLSGKGMKGGDCIKNTLNDQTMDLATATGGNTNKTAEEICFLDFKRRSKVRKPCDENQIQSSRENLVLAQPKRRKLIRPNFSMSITSDDKSIDLGASQNLHVPSSQGSYNVKDVEKSCCALFQTEDNIKADAEVCNAISQTPSEDKNSSHARGYACSEAERETHSPLAALNDKSKCLDSIKADAEVQKIVGPTHTEDKNSHARGYVCGKAGEKSTEGALTAFDDGSKFVENINQNVFASASCKDKSCHIKKSLCVIDCIKSVSPNTESSHSICQEHHVHKITCAGRGNTDEEMVKDCGSSFTVESKDGSEYLQNYDDEKVQIETSCPLKEGLYVTDSIKSVSAGTDLLFSICQTNHTGKIILTGRGSHAKEEMSKDGFDCLQNSINDNASIATSCVQRSVSKDSESLPLICQECYVNKVVCASKTIKSEEGMSKDGRSSFTTEVKDGSDHSQTSGDNALITSC